MAVTHAASGLSHAFMAYDGWMLLSCLEGPPRRVFAFHEGESRLRP